MNIFPVRNSRNRASGLPLVVKNQPANAGGVGSIPDAGRSHMPWGNSACAPRQLSWCSRARELQQLSACAATTAARKPWSLCPATREATVVRRYHTTRESPLLSTSREKPAQQGRPSTAIRGKKLSSLKEQILIPETLGDQEFGSSHTTQVAVEAGARQDGG